MARTSLIAREEKRARLVKQYADVRKRLKAEGKWDELDKLPRNSSPKRLHNRCKVSGRPKGYMRRFGLCRVQFRLMALDGMLPGVTKASW